MLTPHDVHHGQARPSPRATRTHPSPRLEPPSGAIRARDPKAPASSSRGLDQPAGRGYDATACSVNPNRRCLNVVDRFRIVMGGKGIRPYTGHKKEVRGQALTTFEDSDEAAEVP